MRYCAPCIAPLPQDRRFRSPEWRAEGGANFARGAANLVFDAKRQLADLPPAGTEQFRPGHEVALTPGQVVFRKCHRFHTAPYFALFNFRDARTSSRHKCIRNRLRAAES